MTKLFRRVHNTPLFQLPWLKILPPASIRPQLSVRRSSAHNAYSCFDDVRKVPLTTKWLLITPPLGKRSPGGEKLPFIGFSDNDPSGCLTCSSSFTSKKL